MKKPTFDPGLTQKFTGVLRRSINKDGSFNVRRQGTSWRDMHPYLTLLNMNWMEFFLLVFAAYCVMNLLFAVGYYLLGPGALQGVTATTEGGRFLDDFFFSAHTLTTVGYGNIAPYSLGSNIISTIEALVGLLSAALGTGLLFGRFSRPSARIAFSDRILIAPYEDRSSVQFRIFESASQRADGSPGAPDSDDGRRPSRRFDAQIPGIKTGAGQRLFSGAELDHRAPHRRRQPSVRENERGFRESAGGVRHHDQAFDDTFAQSVHARYSYRYDEITWQARFQPAFEITATATWC